MDLNLGNADRNIMINGNPTNFAVPDYDFGILDGCLFDNLFSGDPMFGQVTMAAPEDAFPSMELEDMMIGDDVDEDIYSSGASKKNHDVDRSRTLVCERRRRHRMKEKLYALRSLVPNITKMDKASIVGDAALYVQQLQTKVKKLKSEIAGLEASLSTSAKYQGSLYEPKKIRLSNPNPPTVSTKIIIQMNVFQVEERGFYVRLVCNKEEGIAASLYKALEALSGVILQSSNLATVSETFVLTFTLNVRVSEQRLNPPNLNIWLTRALMNQGFEFKTQMSY